MVNLQASIRQNATQHFIFQNAHCHFYFLFVLAILIRYHRNFFKNKKLHHFFTQSNALGVIEVSGPWVALGSTSSGCLLPKLLTPWALTPTLRDPDLSRDEISIMFKSNQFIFSNAVFFYQCWVVFIE